MAEHFGKVINGKVARKYEILRDEIAVIMCGSGGVAGMPRYKTGVAKKKESSVSSRRRISILTATTNAYIRKKALAERLQMAPSRLLVVGKYVGALSCSILMREISALC